MNKHVFVECLQEEFSLCFFTPFILLVNNNNNNDTVAVESLVPSCAGLNSIRSAVIRFFGSNSLRQAELVYLELELTSCGGTVSSNWNSLACGGREAYCSGSLAILSGDSC